MKRLLKLATIIISAILVCSICNFAYADEEDGRLVDIPVPPSSTGHADSIVQENQQQAENNLEQKNETKADYNKEVEKEPKKDEQTKNDVIETNAEFNQENNTDLEEDNINNEENVISNEENNNVDIHNKDNKNIIAVVIIVALCVIILIIANIKRKRK